MVKYAFILFVSTAFASPLRFTPPYPRTNGTASHHPTTATGHGTRPVGGGIQTTTSIPLYPSLPVGTAPVGVGSTTVPVDGGVMPVKSTTIPGYGTPVPTKITTTVPGHGTPVPTKITTTVPGYGTPVPTKGTTTPGVGTPVPSKSTTIPGLSTTLPKPSTTLPGLTTTAVVGPTTTKGTAAPVPTTSGTGVDTSYPTNVPPKGKQCPAPLAVAKINDNDGIGAGKDQYREYKGDGSAASQWPTMSQWVSFKDMWAASTPVIAQSCTQFGVANPSSAEISQIYKSIQIVAQETKVDHRFILAIIMQESKGCVRVWTTNYGVRNPGLMQDHDGAATCNDNDSTTKDASKVKNPCPEATILDMIREGTSGTPKGDGLVGVLEQAQKQAGNKNDAQTYYRAARNYNSGSTAASGMLEAGIATHCYASDVANRLTGWANAASGCTFDKAGGYA